MTIKITIQGFKISVRPLTTPQQRMPWAYGNEVLRVDYGHRVFEKYDNGKVYVLDRQNSTTCHLLGVIDRPAKKFLSWLTVEGA